ncbi:MAG: lamin tail domain-containing protein [Candidatus Aenigmarchaeota archaeon]|nr:lamin tail domain-containing protein [Candidatus Aenigmarchaeota archaeon]
MKKIALIFLFQFLLFPCFGQIVINEIRYNPTTEQGSDYYSEWIEIYNPTNDSINLSDWELCGKELLAGYLNHTSSGGEGPYLDKGIIFLPKQYAIITDGGSGTKVYQYFNIPNDSLALHVDSSTLCKGGQGLSNSGETINLTDNFGNLIDSVTYDSTWGANGDGNSLQRINQSQNLSNNPTNWIALPPSPGEQNFYENATLELLDISTEEEIYANKTTIILVKILNRGKENATDISVNLSINNIYNNSATVNISGINIAEIQFEWIPTHSGNYTILASLDGQTINNTISVLPQIQKNTTLDICLETKILLDLEYTSLFKITIENKDNCSVKDNITIQYNITNSTYELIKENNFTREIGCSGYSNTGEWTPNQTGNFTLCGRIINVTTNFNNTPVCKNITVINPKTIPCNLTIKISSPLIWSVNEKSKYYIFVNDSSGNYSDKQIEITYWIEDYFGNYIKKPYITTSIETNENKSRDYTPKLDCGTAVYLIKANITNTYCNDTTQEDNLAEKMILLIGDKECEPCPTCKKCSSSEKKESVKPSNLNIDILNLTDILARNQEFTTTVKLKNNFGKKISFEIYSYIFDGSDCLTGSWLANLKKIKLNKDGERIINLTNKVEKDVKPWYYFFRIKIKLEDGSKIDKTEQIKITNKILKSKKEMKEIPKLNIWDDEKLRINLSDCKGCKMIIVGPDFYAITGRKYRVFKDFGRYYIFAIKDSEVILNETYSWGKEERLDNSENTFANKNLNQPSNKTTNKITGKVSEINSDWTKEFLSKFIELFSPLIKLMEESIQ